MYVNVSTPTNADVRAVAEDPVLDDRRAVVRVRRGNDAERIALEVRVVGEDIQDDRAGAHVQGDLVVDRVRRVVDLVDHDLERHLVARVVGRVERSADVVVLEAAVVDGQDGDLGDANGIGGRGERERPVARDRRRHREETGFVDIDDIEADHLAGLVAWTR